MIFRIVRPDSTQAAKIRPVVKEASNKIHAVGSRGGHQIMSIMDSLKLQLKPILTKEQLKRLDGFTERARGRWKGPSSQ